MIDVHALSFPASGHFFLWDDRIRRFVTNVTKNVNQLNFVANLANALKLFVNLATGIKFEH